MTSNGTAYDRAYDKTIPADAPEVARIMRERGVGRRRATHLATKAAAEAIDVSDVDTSQKESVLAAIIKHEARNSQALMEVMNHNGSSIDGHDVVKMLWACQKMGWVTFRERKGGYGKHGERPKIYAIKVTPSGYGHVQDRGMRPWTDEQPVNGGSIAPPMPEPEPPEEEPAVEVGIIQGGQFVAYDGPVLGDYPLIDELLTRAVKAGRLNAAARILEDVGEVDMALSIMEKTNISPLEEEVVRLSRAVFPGMKEVS